MHKQSYNFMSDFFLYQIKYYAQHYHRYIYKKMAVYPHAAYNGMQMKGKKSEWINDSEIIEMDKIFIQGTIDFNWPMRSLIEQ